MTEDDFRRLALGMPDAIESAHMGHPDFRANGRIFATLHPDRLWGTIKLLPEEQQEIMRLHPKVFVPSSGAWGRQGWTNVKLESAEEASVRGAITLAWETVVTKPRRVPAKRSAGRKRAKPARRKRR
jgi:YjbR